MSIENPIRPCVVCGHYGYFSHKHQAVLCDRHYFERNGKPDCTGQLQPSTSQGEMK